MRTFLILLIAASALLAGCSDNGPSDPAGDGDTTDTGTDTGTDSSSTTTTTTTSPDPEPTREPPAETEFSFGPGAGCEGTTAGSGTCASFAAGPDQPAVDGVWLPLDETYWGLKFTTTVSNVSGDSDCYYVADDATTILGDGFNDAGPCKGTIPKNTAYLFLYSYIEPHAGMTVTFKV